MPSAVLLVTLALAAARPAADCGGEEEASRESDEISQDVRSVK